LLGEDEANRRYQQDAFELEVAYLPYLMTSPSHILNRSWHKMGQKGSGRGVGDGVVMGVVVLLGADVVVVEIGPARMETGRIASNKYIIFIAVLQFFEE